MVTETGQPTESWLNKRKSTNKTKYAFLFSFPLFSNPYLSAPTLNRKSLFTGDLAKEHAEIDVNDPDFWKKVLPDLVRVLVIFSSILCLFWSCLW